MPTKYVIVIPDGAADEPQESLGGKTPLQAARTPAMDRIAREGVLGRSRNVPDRFVPASDAQLEVWNAMLAKDFDERDPAVCFMLSRAIAACIRLDKYVGICGQGPSDHPELARWLLDEGIESMSLNPDTVVETWLFLAGQKA